MLLPALLFAAACTEWTTAQDIGWYDSADLNGTNKTEDYYAALRTWKQTAGLPQTFVWFDSWSGTGRSGSQSLSGLPDSVTIASNWGGHPKFDLSPQRRQDMEYVQKVKGTKVVVTLFSAKVGDDMPPDPIYEVGTSTDEAILRPAIAKYAQAIYDACIDMGYDGFDWDYEPTVGGQSTAQAPLWRVPEQSRIFVEELSYWFGKGASDPSRDRGGRKPAKQGLLLLIDGEIGAPYTYSSMDSTWLSYYVDYFVHQAYGVATETNLTNRVSGTLNRMDKWIREGRISKEEVVRRCILTENFESYSSTGGGVLVQSSFVYAPQTGAHAGVEQQIGGFGIYRPAFDYDQGKGDYNGSPEWYYLRKGITNIYNVWKQRAINN
jgi:hypothetical protein